MQQKNAGFFQIGKSNFYKRGDFLIVCQSNGFFQIWENVLSDGCPNGEPFLALKSWKREGEPFTRTGSLILDGSNRILWREAGGNACEYYSGPRGILSLSGKEQLFEAGFSSIFSDSIFFKKEQIGNDEEEYIAVLENERITLLAKKGRSSSHGIPITEIVSYREQRNELTDDREEFVLVKNAFMEFEVSKRGVVPGSQKVFRELKPEEIGMKTYAFLRAEPVVDLQQMEGGSFRQVSEGSIQVLGYTHEQIAFPLLYAASFWKGGFGSAFVLRNKYYTMTVTEWSGLEVAPFPAKEHETLREFVVRREDTKEEMFFTGLTPMLVAKYGCYPCDPKQIIRFFSL